MKKLKKKEIKAKSSNFKVNNKYKTISDGNLDNKNNENIPKVIKIRNPGVDFARVISMYCIVIHHFYYLGRGLQKYSKYQNQLRALEIMVFWHVDGFALISGVVGYKTNKYSNLLYLWIEVLFYSILFHIYFSKIKLNSIIDNKWIELFPMIYERYWYYTQYFGMYLFLPVINKGISILSQSELKVVVISTIGIFSFWRRIKNPRRDIFHLIGGSSSLWFMTFYLTGAYIGKYRKDYKGIKKYIYCFICLFVYGFSSFIACKLLIYNKLFIYNGYYSQKIIMVLKNLMNSNYDSLLTIIQSISITLFCLQINYHKYLSYIITFCGKLTFGVYLAHVNQLVIKNIFHKVFKNDPNNLTLFSTIILFLGKGVKIFFICIFIDYLRNLLFVFLRIRNVCIFLEKIVFKIFG